MKDEFVKLRVSAQEREAWQRSAKVVGLSLSAYVRRCVDEAQALEHALEGEVERARQERKRQKAERLPERPRPQPCPPSPRPHHQRGYVGTIGEALSQADAHHRR
jgi:hypothetical protein